MSTQKQKFELYTKLQALGFTYEEAVQLRRIELTLRRWAEAERNGDIQRSNVTGKPVRYLRTGPFNSRYHAYPISDREAGALRRLAGIVEGRNNRAKSYDARYSSFMQHVFWYHQTDPRDCALYLVRRSDLNGQPIDSVYNRGLAVCC